MAVIVALVLVVAPVQVMAQESGGYVTAWGGPDLAELQVPPDLPPVVAVAAGSHHVVALTAAGTVRSWGGNDLGQTDTPTGLSDVVMVAAGPDHSLALTAEGAVVAWGAGSSEADVPDDLTGVVAIAAGASHNLALRADGTVRAWGSEGPQLEVPEGLDDVVAISAGYTHNLALTADGTVHEWGHFVDWGPDGGDDRSPMPPRLVDVVDVSAGGLHSLALTSDGTVHAWGYGTNGQLPVPDDLGPVSQVAAGFAHSVALTRDGEVRQWGLGPQWWTDLVSDVTSVGAGPATFLSLAIQAAPFDPSLLLTRLAGTGRVETAIAISQESFSDHPAHAVVLARADDFPDAVTGGPLARRHNAPPLLTSSNELFDPVREEVSRVLRPDGIIYLLGGAAALSETVETQAGGLGYDVVRLAGATRFETAIEISRHIRIPHTSVTLATGLDFPDPLTAAASAEGVVLLTAGDQAHPATAAYLATMDEQLYAVGSPAAAAHPEATPLVGDTREGTAVAVAEALASPAEISMARRDAFPDALAGSARGGPLLLTYSHTLSPETAAYLCGHQAAIQRGWIYGGTTAIDDDVRNDAGSRIYAPCP